METLYSGHIHAFSSNISSSTTSAYITTGWGSQSGIVALGVVLGSSISLVGLAFAFITYSLFSDLRSLAGTTLLSLLASLFMEQLLFVVGVGGIQDSDLCLSLSLALLFMKLASLCWICCCCHHSLVLFRNNTNLTPKPEESMGKIFAHYSLFSWGFPMLMLSVAAAFKYKERAIKINGTQILAQIIHDVNGNDSHCWLMEGSSYIWGFLIPATILLFVGFYLSAQGAGVVKLTAALQIDQRARNKIIKRRGLQIGLFVKLLVVLTIVVVVGGVASILNIPEMWAAYSICQGAQGLLIAMLVSCNCKVLKLYAQPRGHKRRRSNYTSLRDGEGGRYGVISVTNPNYEIFNTESPSIESPEIDNQNFMKLAYKEDNFVERNSNLVTQSAVNRNLGELVGALNINDVVKGPTPAPV